MSHDGGPAFPGSVHVLSDADGNPTHIHTSGNLGEAGISALDLFAAFALAGLVSRECNHGAPAEYAAMSYDLAEAMLTERELRALRAKEGA